MSEQVTVMDQIVKGPDGTIHVRFQKQTIDGGLLTIKYHRTSIEPGKDVDAHMAMVNLHLQSMGNVTVKDYQTLKGRVAEAHTAEVIAAFKSAQGEPV